MSNEQLKPSKKVEELPIVYYNDWEDRTKKVEGLTLDQEKRAILISMDIARETQNWGLYQVLAEDLQRVETLLTQQYEAKTNRISTIGNMVVNGVRTIATAGIAWLLLVGAHEMDEDDTSPKNRETKKLSDRLLKPDLFR